MQRVQIVHVSDDRGGLGSYWPHVLCLRLRDPRRLFRRACALPRPHRPNAHLLLPMRRSRSRNRPEAVARGCHSLPSEVEVPDLPQVSYVQTSSISLRLDHEAPCAQHGSLLPLGCQLRRILQSQIFHSLPLLRRLKLLRFRHSHARAWAPLGPRPPHQLARISLSSQIHGLRIRLLVGFCRHSLPPLPSQICLLQPDDHRSRRQAL
mmetsp:Transcript_32022/g.71956  ORF Transcript_32022/g.71956 Transcript_32022/m.71956 type:complete len:207 (+) Transcript_32022:194-814(+)